MNFEYTDPQTPAEKVIGGFFCINAFGVIEPGDDKRFADFLEYTAAPPRLTVYIDSSGGDVDAAIGIGRIIRDRWFATDVGQYLIDHDQATDLILPRKLLPGQCMSAATLVYVGGRLRYMSEGSTFGVHQFSFRNPTPNDVGASQILSARIARYFSEMGISLKFLEISSATSGGEINRLTESDLRALSIVTGGETDVTWSVQAQNGMMYVRGERDSLFGHHKVMLGHIAESGFVFWSVIEAQGREFELTNFGLVEIVVNGEDRRIDISERCKRSINGNYVNIFSVITKSEAQTLAESESFGVQVRFSSEAPLFLGVAPMSTKAGEDQLKTFYRMFA